MEIDLTLSKTHWSLRTKLARALWTYGIEPMVRWLPKSCSFVRVFALRLMGASIGERCLIMPGVTVLMPWNLSLGDFVAIGKGTNIYNFSKIQVGRMSLVSQDCYLCTGSHDYRKPDMPLIHFPIAIGSGCWIAAGVFVAPGVSIPDGTVVAARSVVVKSIDRSWSVWGGNPARFLKTREVS